MMLPTANTPISARREPSRVRRPIWSAMRPEATIAPAPIQRAGELHHQELAR